MFSVLNGGLVSYKYAGKEMIEAIPKPNFWRAPTDNDCGNLMQMRYAQWKIASMYLSHKEYRKGAYGPSNLPQAEETESRAAPPAESQPKKETTPAQTEQAKPEPTAPEIQPEQEPQKTPAEAPATPMPAEPEIPAEPETPPQEVQPKTAYDFEFDIEAIKADCIGIGQSMGLTLDASLTPDTASWWNPVTASQSNQGETLKQNLAGYIRFHTADNLSTYGMDEITHFNIYCEARGNGVYSIYFLFA